MPLDLEGVAGDMLAAMRHSLGDGWRDVSKFAEKEMRRLATSLADVGELAAQGEISLDEAKALVEIHRNTTKIVFLTAKGLGIIAVERALNAAIDVARAPVNAALGIGLL
jgi:hypothetical protein